MEVLSIGLHFVDCLEFQSKNEFLKQLQQENSKLESIESYLKDLKAVDGVDTQEEYEEVKGQILYDGDNVSLRI